MNNLVWVDERICSKLLDELENTRWSNMSDHIKDGIIYMISTPTSNRWITRNSNTYRGITYRFENDLGFNGRYYVPDLDRSCKNVEEVQAFIDYFYEVNRLANILYE